MKDYFESCKDIAMRNTMRINSLENEIAMELYGIPYDELDEDERAEVAYEAHDRK